MNGKTIQYHLNTRRMIIMAKKKGPTGPIIPNSIVNLTVGELVGPAKITVAGSMVEVHRDMPDGSIVHMTIVRPNEPAVAANLDEGQTDKIFKMYTQGLTMTYISSKLGIPRKVIAQIVKDRQAILSRSNSKVIVPSPMSPKASKKP
jgi:hypothetical protein